MQTRATQISAAITGSILGFVVAAYEKLSEIGFFRTSSWGDVASIFAAVFAFALLALFVIGIQTPFDRAWFLDKEQSQRHHETTKRMLIAFLMAGLSLMLAQVLLAIAGLVAN